MRLLIDTELNSIAVKDSTTIDELNIFLKEHNMLKFNIVSSSVLEPTKLWDVTNTVCKTKLKSNLK